MAISRSLLRDSPNLRKLPRGRPVSVQRLRNRTGLASRGTPKRRMWWRDVHAVTGLFAGFFILFLAVTGMPMLWLFIVPELAWGIVQWLPVAARPAQEVQEMQEMRRRG